VASEKEKKMEKKKQQKKKKKKDAADDDAGVLLDNFLLSSWSQPGLFTIEEVATEGLATEIWHDIPVAEVLHHLGNIDQICASLNINQAAGRKIAARAEAYAKNLAAGLSGT
jgi:hypothetical protein